MHFIINGQKHDFIPIKQFRTTHNLPESFSVAHFEPKDFTGLARIDGAGAELKTLHDRIFINIPLTILPHDLMTLVDNLQQIFQVEMYAINDKVQLKPEEVEYAVAGFGDVLNALVYKLISAIHSQSPLPEFDMVYYGWLNDSLRISITVYEYEVDEQLWQVQIVNHAYGRAGLQVNTGDALYFVADGVYACPAQGFMMNLLRDVARGVVDCLVTA